MLKKSIYYVVLLGGLLSLAACAKVQPIVNLQHQPIKRTVTQNQVRSCIVSAGKARHWRMDEMKPGVIRGHIDVRGHLASIDIKYSKKDYSINYRSSENLLARGGSIHRNYNKWVKLLNRNIQACVYNN